MVPAFFAKADRTRSIVHVEFAFTPRLIEWQLMFRDTLDDVQPGNVSHLFIDCRIGIRAPQPGDFNQYDRFVRSEARRAARLRIAILARMNDPVTDRIAARLSDGWPQVGLFHTKRPAQEWLMRPHRAARRPALRPAAN